MRARELDAYIRGRQEGALLVFASLADAADKTDGLTGNQIRNMMARYVRYRSRRP